MTYFVSFTILSYVFSWLRLDACELSLKIIFILVYFKLNMMFVKFFCVAWFSTSNISWGLQIKEKKKLPTPVLVYPLWSTKEINNQ